MVIKQFTQDDFPTFLEFAAVEGWISSEWELKFLLGSFPEGCFSVRESGQPVAFVTSIKYDNSGWIGNLIVNESMRGKGIGSRLMGRTMEALRQAGAGTVWLTASAAGKHIYERLGFVEIDVIKRWKGKGSSKKNCHIHEAFTKNPIMLDALGWGEMRISLVSAARERGEMFGTKAGFLILQDCGTFKQAGPWGCADASDAALLLDAALDRSEESSEIVLDVPERNSVAASLLLSRGFSVVGRTSLMYFGFEPRYRPDKIYALASMGSMG
jgi:ribosomal protein S18 acetylase RimI-like enzyme